MESGQALIIIAAAFIAIVAFVGLAIDMGILISQQAHLRRAVDSAAIAAATQVREARNFENIGEFTANFIRFNGLDTATLLVQRCVPDDQTSADEYSTVTGVTTRISLMTAPIATNTDYDSLRQICASPLPRKQIRVQAELISQFVFMPILGIPQAVLKADAVSEAASIDLVIVFGTGETMGQFTAPRNASGCNTAYCVAPNRFDPRSPADPTVITYPPDPSNPSALPNPGCNANAGPQAAKFPEDGDGTNPKCRPLWDAKQAAKRLIDTLQEGYDRVAIVTYDFSAKVATTLTSTLGQRATAATDSTGAYAAIDSVELSNSILLPAGVGFGQFSPLNANCRWDPNTGTVVDIANACTTPDPNLAIFKNCVGCGIRVAGTLLKKTGRPESLWLIVFLSDGFANMSDVPDYGVAELTSRSGTILASGIEHDDFPNGFCPGAIVDPTQRTNDLVNSSIMWSRPVCVKGKDLDTDGVLLNTSISSNPELKQDTQTRYCGPYHFSQANCAPGARYIGSLGYTATIDASQPYAIPAIYDVYDYALDMIDITALTTRCATGSTACSGGVWPPNTDEYNSTEFNSPTNTQAPGAPITIYAIGLGDTVITTINDRAGERLLRYMAAVGDDGDRVTDPCALAASGVSCGNYYFAPEVSALDAVFQDIAQRIFTRLTR
jgi:hypothetical protein